MSSNYNRYQRIAPYYDLIDLRFEHGRYRKLRPQLFAGLSGRILDAGVGTGRNIPFYPPGAEIAGINISPAMLARAERRRHRSAVAIAFHEMDVTCLSFPDDSFVAAVATFLFCVLLLDERQVAALRELGRVVKTGGLIRFLEYVRPHGTVRRFASRLWSPWISWAYEAGFDRRAEEHIRDAGLEIAEAHFAVDDLIKQIKVRVS